ncbi:hypothetical protein FCL47_00775 [Desulfopila sp. IMCC35006]|uniref:hypothetical protein n=1 Tax=Desulfopila sp. IMCC35006 TaxID=2569542 RepID=UPI0010ABA665|nr:hypothetical protein [Desulfopila sp. IMCC35006]TKB28058.1 hypothetical protein FCL47_00775 [Desulfopila sp. IMCC35006]
MFLVLVAAIITTTYCIILHDHIILTASSVTVVFLSIIALLYSNKTGKYQMLVKPVILYFFVLMIVTWIANDGTRGATPYFIFILMTIGILLLKKPFPVFVVIIFTTLAGLMGIDYFYPSILIGYETKTQQFLDIAVSLFVCLFFNSLIIYVVFREYLRERRLKDKLLVQTIRDKEELERAHKEIKILKGIIPVCAGCKKIRDKKGDWNRMEDYLNENSEAKLTHGICPDCFTLLYPDL